MCTPLAEAAVTNEEKQAAVGDSRKPRVERRGALEEGRRVAQNGRHVGLGVGEGKAKENVRRGGGAERRGQGVEQRRLLPKREHPDVAHLQAGEGLCCAEERKRSG